KTSKFPAGQNPAVEQRTAQALRQFEEALDDDLNTAEALGAIFEFVRDVNTAIDAGDFLSANAAAALALLAKFDSVFDVLKPSVAEGAIADVDIDALIAERTAAKKSRNFARADEIRNQLLAQGVILEDTKEGVRWKRK
ncbi:MAG: cysteine--tRNA ligase, partial [Bryobacterales bacterium]|nr:cysteine--tRNA ligase [Bryobacterales bacterium]